MYLTEFIKESNETHDLYIHDPYMINTLQISCDLLMDEYLRFYK